MSRNKQTQSYLLMIVGFGREITKKDTDKPVLLFTSHESGKCKSQEKMGDFHYWVFQLLALIYM